MTISGTVHVLMRDGTELDITPDTAYEIPPGYDAWVVGDEPYVTYDFAGMRGFLIPPEATGERILATILFTDVVDSTSSAERMGEVVPNPVGVVGDHLSPAGVAHRSADEVESTTSVKRIVANIRSPGLGGKRNPRMPEVVRDVRLAAGDPCVVARRDLVDGVRRLDLLPVPHQDVDGPGDRDADVVVLAEVGPGDRPDVLRPAPARLQTWSCPTTMSPRSRIVIVTRAVRISSGVEKGFACRRATCSVRPRAWSGVRRSRPWPSCGSRSR